MKKKYPISSKNKKDWLNFTKELKGIYNKESFNSEIKSKIKKVRKLDLHGSSLNQANERVKKFILESFDLGYSNLLIITGKGLHSKVTNDPYRSKNLNVLKNSIPEYINKDQELLSKIIKMSQAKKEDGGEGAFNILLKNKKNL